MGEKDGKGKHRSKNKWVEKETTQHIAEDDEAMAPLKDIVIMPPQLQD